MTLYLGPFGAADVVEAAALDSAASNNECSFASCWLISARPARSSATMSSSLISRCSSTVVLAVLLPFLRVPPVLRSDDADECCDDVDLQLPDRLDDIDEAAAPPVNAPAAVSASGWGR